MMLFRARFAKTLLYSGHHRAAKVTVYVWPLVRASSCAISSGLRVAGRVDGVAIGRGGRVAGRVLGAAEGEIGAGSVLGEIAAGSVDATGADWLEAAAGCSPPTTMAMDAGSATATTAAIAGTDQDRRCCILVLLVTGGPAAR
jgi:hypothetical protein